MSWKWLRNPNGGDGNDLIDVETSDSTADSLDGGNGSDTIQGQTDALDSLANIGQDNRTP